MVSSWLWPSKNFSKAQGIPDYNSRFTVKFAKDNSFLLL